MPKRVTRRTTERPSSTRRSSGSSRTSSRTSGRSERKSRKDGDAPVRSGWAGHDRTKAAAGDFPEDFKIEHEKKLIKFLEDEPFASYRQHWIERPGKKSFTCIEVDCPLCDAGDRPSGKTCFNILSLSEGGKPVNKVLTVGVRLGEQIRGFATDRKTGPLTRMYYAISKTGKKTKTSHSLIPVKERDLEEDWDMEPLDEEELEAFKEHLYDEEAVQVSTRKQLLEIAEEISGEDDEYDDDDDDD